MVKSALETPEDRKGPLDWRVVFFPWQNEPTYCDAVPRPLSEETRRYFADKPAITPGQQSWFQRKRAEQARIPMDSITRPSATSSNRRATRRPLPFGVGESHTGPIR